MLDIVLIDFYNVSVFTSRTGPYITVQRPFGGVQTGVFVMKLHDFVYI